MYISVSEVRNILGVTDTSVISDATITQAILFAQDEVDRLTHTTYYPVEENGTATASDTTELTDDTQSWTDDEWIGYAVYIYSGTGEGQIREITDNDSTTLTVATWTTKPDATSKYVISYLNKQTVTIDGTGGYMLLLKDYPIVQIDSLSIEDTAIASTEYTVYKNTGKIILDVDATKNIFTGPIRNLYLQQVEVTYHWGVLPEAKHGTIKLNNIIKRATGVIASLQTLAYQMGGTYDDLSTFNLPEFSGSIGQAYVNIKGVVDVLNNELNTFKKEYLGKFPYMV